MRILLVSDSHGNNAALDELVKKYPKMDFYLHLGDFESDTHYYPVFRFVKGNCDYFSDALERLIIPIPNGTIIAQHRPEISKNILRENKCVIFLHGHTHRRRNEVIDNIHYINPGSISFSRDGNDLSYAIIELIDNDINVTFYSLSDNLYKTKTRSAD